MYEVTIIGGGPGGVAAGIYAARKKLNAILVADSFGGQSVVSNDIQNWIGIKTISGFDLAKQLEEHLKAQTGIEIVEGDRVLKIEKQKKGFVVTTQEGKSWGTQTILLAIGSRRRELNVSGEKEFWGNGVAYCGTCDAPLFAGKRVAVVGGGNSGLETVLDLVPYAKEIFLLHRNSMLKGDPITQEKIRKEPKVALLLNTEVQMIMGKKTVTGLHYRKAGTKKEFTLDVEGVFVEIGSVPNADLVKDFVELNTWGQIVVDHKTQRSSDPGIWAAGDVTDGFYKQNNISVGDSIKAVMNIYDALRAKGQMV
ncbi:MAG: FAD-dependent oxidoreductase [Patescibacteria group bacterium]